MWAITVIIYVIVILKKGKVCRYLYWIHGVQLLNALRLYFCRLQLGKSNIVVIFSSLPRMQLFVSFLLLLLNAAYSCFFI